MSDSGTANYVTVDNGGIERVGSGGVTNNITVSSGGQEIVFGGAATNTTLQAGGSEVIEYGGIGFVTSGFSISGVLLSSGGQNVIIRGGLATKTAVTSGGTETDFGSSVSGAITGGEELIENGGTVISFSVSDNGLDIVASGGVAIGTTLLVAGLEYDFGTVEAAVISNGGQELVQTTGFSTGDSVGAGGQEVVYSGGTATDADVLSGGVDTVYSGGIASNTNIQNGGSQLVYFSGDSIKTSINSGGSQIIEFYGSASVTTVNDGGTETVTYIGFSYNTSVLNGGLENVSSSGFAYDTMVFSGGTENVLLGGTENGSTIDSGGQQIVASGGTVVDPTIDGGSVVLASGSAISGIINFVGNLGTLVIAGTSLPTNVISGFDATGTTGDIINLSAYSFSSSDTVSLGAENVLTLNLSGTIVTLSFDPSQSFAGDYFALEEGSSGQVVVVDPTIASSLTDDRLNLLAPINGETIKHPKSKLFLNFKNDGFKTTGSLVSTGDIVSHADPGWFTGNLSMFFDQSSKNNRHSTTTSNHVAEGSVIDSTIPFDKVLRAIGFTPHSGYG